MIPIARLVPVLCVAAATVAANAEPPQLRLANVFAAGVVLQRDRPVPVWGQAAPHADVTVGFKGQVCHRAADAAGRWMVVLEPLSADPEPDRLSVAAGGETVVVEDVLVGDVWVSAGPGLRRATERLRDAPAVIARAHFPRLRILRPDIYESLAPVADIPPPGRWVAAKPDTIGEMPIDWFLGRELHLASGVPVGFVLANRGRYAHEWRGWPLDPVNTRYANRLEALARELPADVARATSWLASLGQRRHGSDALDLFPLPASVHAPWYGQEPAFTDTSAVAFNAAIGPLAPLAIRGIVFNADFDRAMPPAEEALVELVASWRAAWRRPGLPFVIPGTLATHDRAGVIAAAIRAAAVIPGVATLPPPEGTTEFTSEPYWEAVAETALAIPPDPAEPPVFHPRPAASPVAVEPPPARRLLEAAGLFTDNMVLQCDRPTNVWGWCEPGDTVRVRFAGHEATARAAADGRWDAVLPEFAATAEPGLLEIATAAEKLAFSNVVVGEVWINSGQSNAGFVHAACLGFEEEQPRAELPAIRYFSHLRTTNPWPQRKNFGAWVVVSPKTAGAISGTGYWFAKTLHARKNVPVGIIEANQGGSSILLWMSDRALASSPAFAPFAAERKRFLDRKIAELPMAEETLRTWVAAAGKTGSLDHPLPPLPIDAGPRGPLSKPLSMRGCLLYNGMIHPLIGCGIRGVLWNQGEADTGQPSGAVYDAMLLAMVADWRLAWGDEFAFYVVQMPAVKDRGGLTEMWQLQARAVAKMPSSGMIVCNDISEPAAAFGRAIHPRDKRSVGERLARLALVRSYHERSGEDRMGDASPMMLAVGRAGGRAVVTFSSPGDGLTTRDGRPADSWEIAGPDGRFVPATAEIDANRVIVSAAAVAEPAKVRLGWQSDSNCNLVNSAGLPALPFLAAVSEGTTYHVSPAGDDAGPGSAATPFRTIQRAAEAAHPGDTVLVHPGIYRERVAPPRGGVEGRPIVFRSLDRHGAVIKGSDVWTLDWRDEGSGIWSGAIDEALFTDTAHVDGPNPFRVPSAATPWGRDGRPEHARAAAGAGGFSKNADPEMVYTLGQVFVDGEILEQVPFRRELAAAPGTWWFDPAAGRLFVHFPDKSDGGSARPEDHALEITTRRRIFAPHIRGLGFIEVEGFVLEHCGNQYPADFWLANRPEWQQAGAVGTRSGHHWRIAHNVIRHANGPGLDLGGEGSVEADLEGPVPGHTQDPAAARHSPGYHLVEGNEILANGAAGTASYRGTHLVLRRNVVMRNNALRFTGTKRWESAGIKLHAPHDSVIEGNLIADNHGRWGLWLDCGAGERSRVMGNVVIGHEVGIDVEFGRNDSCLMANNLLVANATGVRFREAGGVTLAHNTILGSTAAAIDWPSAAPRPGNWSAANVGIFNNLVAGTGQAIVSAAPADDPRHAGRRFDGNWYGFAAPSEAWAVGKQPLDFAAWRDLWRVTVASAGSDERSGAVGPFAHEFDRAAGRLVITLPADLPGCGLEAIPGVDAGSLSIDIAGQRRSPSASAIPGCWANLTPGENTFWLPTPLPSAPRTANAAAGDRGP